jgi:hypothetical protein
MEVLGHSEIGVTMNETEESYRRGNGVPPALILASPATLIAQSRGRDRRTASAHPLDYIYSGMSSSAMGASRRLSSTPLARALISAVLVSD